MKSTVMLALVFAGSGSLVAAETRSVFAEAADGTRIEIAKLNLEDDSYDLSLVDEVFTDHFLSMRPFKCLEGPDKHWCYVPYPYENARSLATDLTDLEYDLLFLWKGSGEYGINMWNGVYYKLAEEDGAWTGTLHEINMDVLSAPPEDGNLRPIREVDLEPGDPDSHWLPRLVIE